MLLIVFAFLAGIFTILSPCILPILPALLSGAAGKGRYRPLGIVIGLIVSFTFFTLALTAIVQATGLSANVLRYVAIVLVFLFGLVMVIPRASDWFARLTAPLADVGPIASSGFGGGLLFGAALGLLWTPCAGPILASVTALVATQAIGFDTVMITLAYSIGAGIPMLLIAYGGNRVIQSSKFFSRHAEGIRQGFGVVIMLTAVAIALHWDMWLQERIINYIPPIEIEYQEEKMRPSGPAPELKGITAWINSPPLTIEGLKGKVVLIDFWTYSCINCLRTLPYITKWYEDYKDLGLVVIGVHTPEFEFEKDYNNVLEATKRLGVKYPVALDNNYQTWRAFNNRYWPAHYLIDQQGIIRMEHFGEGGYVETENAIRALLGLPPSNKAEVEALVRPITPETYLGTIRGNRDAFQLKGPWKVEGERITAMSDESYLELDFLASQVYLVLSGKSLEPLEIFLDGKKTGSLLIDSDRKYDIVDTGYGRHHLSLKVPKGISAYAFTFGDEYHGHDHQ